MTNNTPTPSALAAEVRHHIHNFFTRQAAFSTVDLHEAYAAIDRLAEDLRISRQSEREAWRYAQELSADRDRLAALASAAHGEPVAWMNPAAPLTLMVGSKIKAAWLKGDMARLASAYTVPLYTRPADPVTEACRLPELPEPEIWCQENYGLGDVSTTIGYSEKQMQDYARAALQANDTTKGT